MLRLEIPETELYNNKENEFITIPKTTLVIEHSLKSVSKWECLYSKSFFDKRPKTPSEVIDYIKCMTLNHELDDIIYTCLTKDHFDKIKDYMLKPMTARRPYKKEEARGTGYITSEDFYHRMIWYGIPLECEKWHLNKLIALINYCQAHDPNDNRKMNPNKQRAMYRDLNRQRRAALHSKG